MQLELPGGRTVSRQTPVIVGILNVTPDSFSDGGSYPSTDDAVSAARRMINDGADIIDIGGESTRPGAQRVSAREQIQRVVPTIERLANEFDTPLSIDTTRSEVADAALRAGASIINDVSAGREASDMFTLAAERDAPIILMHMLGEPTTMQASPTYDNVVDEVAAFLGQRVEQAASAGVDRSKIMLDPGIGFGKTLDHNLSLLANLDRFTSMGYPVMLGASRKRFIDAICDEPEAAKRVFGTVATTALGIGQGVRMFRVHDVAANRQAADVAFRIVQSRPES